MEADCQKKVELDWPHCSFNKSNIDKENTVQEAYGTKQNEGEDKK